MRTAEQWAAHACIKKIRDKRTYHARINANVIKDAVNEAITATADLYIRSSNMPPYEIVNRMLELRS